VSLPAGKRHPSRGTLEDVRARTARGIVKDWHHDLGWGVLVSPEVPGEVWVHFSAVEGTGYRYLTEGAEVDFVYRRGHYEPGFSFVADSVRQLP
jgi:CspA family cold shock protein